MIAAALVVSGFPATEVSPPFIEVTGGFDVTTLLLTAAMAPVDVLVVLDAGFQHT